MQSDSFLLNTVYSVVFGTLFPLFLFASRTFERRSRGFEIADAVVSAFLALRPKYLDAVKGNVAQVLGLKVTHPSVDRIARQTVRNHAYSWVDFFRFAQRPPEAAFALFDSLEGAEHLERMASSGEAAILVSAHAGNYELGSMLLRTTGLKMYAVYKPDRFEAVERIRSRLRDQVGVIGVPVDGVGFSTLPLLKLLREGKVVGMQGDRDFSLNGLAIPFFGREVHFPRGPWELAAMTGAPVIAAFFFMDEEHRFHARFFEPQYIHGERGSRRAAIEQGIRRYATWLEELLREFPDQWYCFYPFWDDPMRKEASI